MKFIKESEVTIGNASGKAGTPSIPFGRGYFQSINSGSPGISFTPSGDITLKSYKNMKHSRNNLKKKNKMKKFKNFIKEDAATMGNSGGMGAVVSAQPSSIPGDVAGSTIGSGDIGTSLGTYSKIAANPIGQKLIKKKKTKSPKIIKSFANFNPIKEKEEISNNTARWFDNFDDEEEDNTYENSNDIKRIQLFENFKDKVTYEMSGPPPKNLWIHKEDFVKDMNNWGYLHTTLNRNTDMLIVTERDLATLKCQKAKKYNIPIYTYEEVFKKKSNLYSKTIRSKKIKTLKNQEN